MKAYRKSLLMTNQLFSAQRLFSFFCGFGQKKVARKRSGAKRYETVRNAFDFQKKPQYGRNDSYLPITQK